MPGRFKRNLIIALALAAGLYIGLAFYADFDQLAAALGEFDWLLLPLALALTFVNYLFRYIKWEFLVRSIGIRVPILSSFIIFISGLTMTISPAKMGEVMKSFLLKDHSAVPVRRSSPVIMAERITDVIGVVVLGCAGTLAYGLGRSVLVIAIVLMAALVALIQSRGLSLRLLALAERIPGIGRFAEHFQEFYENAYELLKARRLVPAVALSIVGWSFECLAAYVCLRGLGVDLPIALVTFIFVISSLAGALAMIPGGLGVAEGSIAGLLVANGVERADAVAGTMLIRLVTFWFAIALGLAGLVLYSRVHRGGGTQDLSDGSARTQQCQR